MIPDKITLEDIQIRLPIKEKASSKITSSMSIRHSKIGHYSSKKYTYDYILLNDTDLLKLSEMSSNPYFSAIPIYDMSKRINTGFIEKSSRDWQYGASKFSFTMQRGYHKFLFLQETIERPLHDRWKILIDEDFSTDAVWPSNADIAASPFNSLGTSDQTQDIVWTDVSGDWEDDTDLDDHLSGDNCLLHNDDVAAILVAGWDWWENYEVEVFFQCADNIADDTGLIFRYVDSTHYYKLMNTAASSIGLYDNATAIIVDTSLTLVADTWYHMKVRVQGNKIECYLNGTKLFNGKDITSTTYTAGEAGMYSALNNTYFDNFKVTLLPPTNFNLAASTDWTNQYSHADISTAHGTQKKLIAPDNNVQFKQSKAGGDCILYLPMNEGQGDIVKDHSKYGNDGKIEGATWIEDDEKGWCLDFDGVNDFIDIPVSSTINFDDEITIDLLIKHDSTGSYPDQYLGTSIHFGAWDTAGLFTYVYGPAYHIINQAEEIAPTEDQWTRYTIIYSGGFGFVFENGQILKIEPDSGNVTDWSTNWNFMRDNATAGRYTKGRIKGVRIFNKSRWDVADGFDSTPTTVFVHDTNQFNPDVAYPDDSDCVGLWRFDEGAGTDADITYDASGKGHDATLTDITGWGLTSFRGEAGTCLDFESDNTDYLTVADHADFSFAGDVSFSIEGWIKPETISGSDNIITKYTGAGNQREWRFYLVDGKVYFRLYHADGSAYIGRYYNTALSASTWYYVVATYDGSEAEAGINIYVNGVVVDDQSTSSGSYTGMTAGTSDVYIGRIASGEYYDGLIDEVRIHRKELSAAEIASRYRSEPYLDDKYLQTRVYDKSHQFKGLPVISNGLVKLSFADYDTYELRAANILAPNIYAWYQNSWHLQGTLMPWVTVNATDNNIAFDKTEWNIEELTDQYCKLSIKYYESSGTLPEGSVFEYKYIIKNGYPGVLVETSSGNWEESENLGFVFYQSHEYGTGLTNKWYFAPENRSGDAAVVAGDVTLDTTIGGADEIDDNWMITYPDSGDCDANSKQVITGFFSDSMLDDLGTDDQFDIDYSDDLWRYVVVHNTKFGGIFFVPYDISTIVAIPGTIPFSNSINYPSDLAHMSFSETNLCRGLKK